MVEYTAGTLDIPTERTYFLQSFLRTNDVYSSIMFLKNLNEKLISEEGGEKMKSKQLNPPPPEMFHLPDCSSCFNLR